MVQFPSAIRYTLVTTVYRNNPNIDYGECEYCKPTIVGVYLAISSDHRCASIF